MTQELKRFLGSLIRSENLSTTDRKFIERMEGMTNNFIHINKGKELQKDFKKQVSEYKEKSHDVDVVQQTWQKFWDIYSHKVGETIQVSKPDLNEKELKALEKEGRMLIYVPEEVSKKEQIVTLLHTFKIGYYLNNPANPSHFKDYVNGFEQKGWFSTEAQGGVPNGVLTDDRFTKLSEDSRSNFMTLNTYLVTSYFSYLNGNILDGARDKNSVLNSYDVCALPNTYHDKSGGRDFICTGSYLFSGLYLRMMNRTFLTRSEKSQLGFRTVEQIGSVEQKKLF